MFRQISTKSWPTYQNLEHLQLLQLFVAVVGMVLVDVVAFLAALTV